MCSTFEILKNGHLENKEVFIKSRAAQVGSELRSFRQNNTGNNHRNPWTEGSYVWFYLTLLNAKYNLDKICVHMEFALVREDPKDR